MRAWLDASRSSVIRRPVLNARQTRTPRRPAQPGYAGQLARFVTVGAASTVAYVLLYLRGVPPAQAANAISLLLTAVANTAVNRRLTFGIAAAPTPPATRCAA